MGCKKEPAKPAVKNAPPTDTGIKFYLLAKNNTGKFTTDTVALTMAGDSVVGVVPGISNEKSFVLSFSPASANVKIGFKTIQI